MLNWLRKLLIPDLTALLDQLRDMERRLRALEGEQLTIATEWLKTRDQVLRSVKRMGALRRGLGAPRTGDPDGDDLGELELVDDDWEATQREATRLKLTQGRR